MRLRVKLKEKDRHHFLPFNGTQEKFVRLNRDLEKISRGLFPYALQGSFATVCRHGS